MMNWGRWLLPCSVFACTPATDPGASVENIDVASDPDLQPLEPAPVIAATMGRQHACRQLQPDPDAFALDPPWIWRDDSGRGCEPGCTSQLGWSATQYDGIGVVMEASGDVVVESVGTSGPWKTRVPAGGLVTDRVQWLGDWCEDSRFPQWPGPTATEPIFLARAGAGRLHVTLIERASGRVILEREHEVPTGGSQPGVVELQLHCDGRGAQIHAKRGAMAWVAVLAYPSLDIVVRRDVPPALIGWEWRDHLDRDQRMRGVFLATDRPPPSPDGPYEQVEREEVTTGNRRYVRIGPQLFALDRAGNPLWHRELAPVPGCLEPSWELCGNCRPDEYGLGRKGEFIVLWKTGGRAAQIDVFDHDGREIVRFVQ